MIGPARRRPSLGLWVVALVLLACGIVIGRYYGHDSGAPAHAALADMQHDRSGREEVACPAPADAFVLALFGQSNSANYVGHRFAAQEGERILNRFEGRCYRARDPLLGATGDRGSIAIPLARELDIGKAVVIESFGVSGTEVADWLPGGSVRDHFEDHVADLKQAGTPPDYILWIQGESDEDTGPGEYRAGLEQLMRELTREFPGTAIGLTGTSYCRGYARPEIVAIQRAVAKDLGLAFLGETDRLRDGEDRYDDCHFSERGARKLAAALAAAIAGRAAAE